MVRPREWWKRAGLEPASPACKAEALPIELSSRTRSARSRQTIADLAAKTIELAPGNSTRRHDDQAGRSRSARRCHQITAKASDQACDQMCAIRRVLARTAGVEPTPPEWRSGTLPLSHVRDCSVGCRYCEQPPWSWWVGMELNHHSRCGAFTTPWARQCPAYPCAAASDHCVSGERRELAEGEGVEPSTQRSARLSRPVAHHCAPPSVMC